MNLVDASGWMEYFGSGPQAHLFGKIIEDTKHLIVPTVCIYEIFKKSLQTFDEKKALEIVAVMRTAEVVPLDDQTALAAAALSYKFKLPMADSMILATARQQNAVLWTQDADFALIPGIKYFPKKT